MSSRPSANYVIVPRQRLRLSSMPIRISILFLLLCCLGPKHVYAQDAKSPKLRNNKKQAEPSLDFGYWSQGKTRFFASTRMELGAPYLRPAVAFGYGKPHWIWTGVDFNAITTVEFAQAYGGVRVATPVLDISAGFRDTASYNKTFYSPQQQYTRSDVYDTPGARARYWAFEFEAVGIVPLPHAALVADFIFIHSVDVPSNRVFYDESYRALVADSTYFVFRFAALARLLNQDSLRVGVLAEHVFGTARPEGVWRIGPVLSFQLTEHLEIASALTMAVASPDSLGFVLGAYGVAGLRYRWATGESNPKLPWRGEMLP
ncbi:MAG: hypothetical protein IPJ88_16460 [Myxococcales bacterium]|nr:MAG: hypothetical protein IPJ88_16460 [Myxococcales bacterium]